MVSCLEQGEQLGIICGYSFCLRWTMGGASFESDTKALARATCCR